MGMTYAAIVLLILAALLRTRLGRLKLALVLLKVSNATGDAGSRVLENVKADMGKRS
ncbi:MAG: hypothetical protein JNK47_20300 [Mesorhizobium sp.]|nr:hypothetical protein [Mesorhizobium sp.]MBL8579553.1 hypothetical protein [Mesorhizobium sp.]